MKLSENDLEDCKLEAPKDVFASFSKFSMKEKGQSRPKGTKLVLDNSLVRFEPEAYVVSGLRAPLLLGEDFRSSYELGVDRSATGLSGVRIGRTPTHLNEASSTVAVD